MKNSTHRTWLCLALALTVVAAGALILRPRPGVRSAIADDVPVTVVSTTVTVEPRTTEGAPPSTLPQVTVTTTSVKPTPAPPSTPRTLARPAPKVAPAPATGGSSGEAFRRCVLWRESGGDYHASSAGGYGILTSTWRGLGRPGTAGAASPATQDAAFWQLYARDGVRPWRPYDHC